MIKWVNFLHIYQPPYQEAEVVKKICQESYWPLAKILNHQPQTKLTLNFSGCLLEHLYNIGEQNLIDEFKKLAAAGQIELVGSAKYHPILPLLPAGEIKRQIQLNDEILRQAFGDLYQPTGFFLPEMAYSRKTAKIIKELGFKWLIIDEIAYQGEIGLVDYSKKYQLKGLGLNVIFRNRQLSRTYVPQTILDLTTKSAPPAYLISATDGEMYGHHHTDYENRFEKVLTHARVKTLTVSEYLKELPAKAETVNPVSSSWESTAEELKNKIPFALWQDPKNKIHQNLWELRKIAINLINKNKASDANYDFARKHLDRGLASCAWWWAAEKKIGDFNFLTWNPDTIEKGLKELISSIRSLKNISRQTKLKAEKYYHLLIKEIWRKHWKKYHKIQPAEAKMPSEVKRGLSLLNQNFLIPLFQKRLPKSLIGDHKIDYIAIEIFKKKLSHTSFYHIVSRYTLHFKNPRVKPVTIFCNANSRESRQGALLALKHLWQSGFATGRFLCPQPLFYNKRSKAIFYKEATGKNLYQFIIDKETEFGEIEKIVSLTGQWLAKLHSLPVAGVPNFNSVQSKVTTVLPGPKKIFKIINEKHQKYPKYLQQTKELLGKISQLEKKLTAGEKKAIIHGDFHPENVVYNKHRDVLYIIDYTDCCLGHFTRDLGNFYQQLNYMAKEYLSAEQIKHLQRLFVDSYQSAKKITLTPEEEKIFNLYKGWTALRSAIYFLTVTAFDRPRADALFEETRYYLKKI
ncbi:MAG: phosphotransferase [Patescibacteria group bacterium]|jgi:alpha-amylase/alpha-mannosidase (GH57 family)